MKALMAIPFGLALAACSVSVDHDAQSGDVKDVHISIGPVATKKGDGKLATEKRAMAAIKTIESSGPIDVEVSVGGAPGLTVLADANLLQSIHTTVDGDRLVIEMKDHFSSSNRLIVQVSTPTLSGIHNVGSGDIKVAGLNGGDLSIDSTSSGDTTLKGKVGALSAHLVGSGDLNGDALSANTVAVDMLGSGSANFGELNVDRFDANLKGSGDVKASGKAKAVKANVLGSGDVSLAELEAEDLDLELMGSGDIEAYASKSVRARAHGSGDITIHGHPAQRDLQGENAQLAD